MTDNEALDIIAPVMERLDKLTIAVEKLVAVLKPSDLATFHQEAPRTAPEPRQASSGPLDPEPPFPAEVLAPSAPIPQVPFPPMQPNWQAGMVHQNGHKPLKVNSKGIYCPTKMPDDSWCAWRPGR